MPSFLDELVKISANVPFIHGTNQSLKKLVSGVGSTILKNDPNPRGVYTAARTRKAIPGIEQFAHEATRKRGGTPTVVSGKMDTKKGWRPFNTKPGSGLDVEEARELASSLDATASKADRGVIWKKLNKSVGSWHNPDTSASLKVLKSRGVTQPQALKRSA